MVAGPTWWQVSHGGRSHMVVGQRLKELRAKLYCLTSTQIQGLMLIEDGNLEDLEV